MSGECAHIERVSVITRSLRYQCCLVQPFEQSRHAACCALSGPTARASLCHTTCATPPFLTPAGLSCAASPDLRPSAARRRCGRCREARDRLGARGNPRQRKGINAMVRKWRIGGHLETARTHHNTPCTQFASHSVMSHEHERSVQNTHIIEDLTPPTTPPRSQTRPRARRCRASPAASVARCGRRRGGVLPLACG